MRVEVSEVASMMYRSLVRREVVYFLLVVHRVNSLLWSVKFLLASLVQLLMAFPSGHRLVSPPLVMETLIQQYLELPLPFEHES
jgi:hypothetical protein